MRRLAFDRAVAVTSLPGAMLWLAGGHRARDAQQAADFAAREAAAEEPPH